MVAATQTAASIITFAPAKLNVFLELHGRRSDGFHDLQTVMLAVDRFDRLRLVPRDDGQIILHQHWAPSTAVWRQRLGFSVDSEAAEVDRLLSIPTGSDNLVCKALAGFRERFAGEAAAELTGFDVELAKSIPAGAGMGGASSDAASAIRAAAAFAAVAPDDPRLWELAADLGSDIPFFLGVQPARGGALRAGGGDTSSGLSRAVMATGRGEKLSTIEMHGRLFFVICYPPQSLSTAEVFRKCTIPEKPTAIEPLADAIRTATAQSVGTRLFNRLSEPARKLSPHVERILQEMRSVGLTHAQMTGSGSACFAIAPTQRRARRAAQLLSSRRLGVTMVARSIAVPTPIVWHTA